MKTNIPMKKPAMNIKLKSFPGLGLLALKLLLAGCLAATAQAQVNYAISGKTAYVTNSPNVAGDIVIASNYKGFPVTSIGDEAFFYNYFLTSVATL